jgi:hypothetical protein
MPPKVPPPLPLSVSFGPQWEYQLLPVDLRDDISNLEQNLNTRGEHGWELVTLFAQSSKAATLVFKRKRRPTPQPPT